MRPESGDVISGRYRLEQSIGAGGMGVVWRARDDLLERQVAVKCARPDDNRAARRLRSEARNAGRLHHPNIVGVFDFVEEDGVCWIVMEYVPSRSLAQIVAERGPLAPGETGAIGRQIADALAASHAEGVVHGDVTPENVLVTAGGTAKLTDYGISRALWSDGSHSLTGGVRGKPRYLPPEVANGERADARSDVFSLGATLFAAVEGRSPYGEADHALAYLGRAMEGRTERPRRAGRLTGPLTVLLDADPGRRPDAARARALLSGGPQSPDGAHRPTEPEDDSTAVTETATLLLTRPPGRRRSGRAVTITLLVLAAAAAAVWAISWGGDDTSGGGPGGVRAGTAGRGPRAVVGDVRTADPCALLDASVLARFGDTELVPDYGEFDRCDVLVHSEDGGDLVADVKLNFAGDPAELDSQVPARTIGAVTVAEVPGEEDECVRNLELADGNQIWIIVEEEGPSAPEPCELARAATDHAVTVLNRGPVPRRPAPFPDGSLALVDACDLLDSAALAVIEDIDGHDPDRDFADWGCDWHSTTSDAGVGLTFSRDNALSDDGRPTRLGGRRSYVAPEDEGEGTCVVRTEHRSYPNTTGGRTIELVMLTVHGPDPVGKLCDTAEALATAVAKRLPRT